MGTMGRPIWIHALTIMCAKEGCYVFGIMSNTARVIVTIFSN